MIPDHFPASRDPEPGRPAGLADLLLVNANVLTMNPGRPRARSVAVAGGHIIALDATPARLRANQVIDVRGATVLPGFHDAHNHMAWFGLTLTGVDLRGPAVSSMADLYAAVARRAAATETAGWVMGSGYDQNKIGEHPDRDAPDQVARAARLAVVAVPQGRFATELGDGMLAAVGPGRHSWLYRQRSLLNAGMMLAGSSDRPVVTGAPLLGIHDMVNRRTASGTRFNADEAITAEQALHAYTSGSAYAGHAEHIKGTVTPGKLADLVVLSEDPTAIGPDRISGVEVLATFVDGLCRYHAGALDGQI